MKVTTMTIDSDHAKLVKSKENDVITREVLDDDKKESETAEESLSIFKTKHSTLLLSKRMFHQKLNESPSPEENDRDMQVPIIENDLDLDSNVEFAGSDTEERAIEQACSGEEVQVDHGVKHEQTGKLIDFKQLKPNLLIGFKKSGETDWNHGCFSFSEFPVT